MTNLFLQCLNNSKILLLHAENESWDDFELLQPIWSQEIEKCLVLNDKELNVSDNNMVVSIEELIDDVDKIQNLIKTKMSKIETEFSDSLRMNKAVKTYLK